MCGSPSSGRTAAWFDVRVEEIFVWKFEDKLRRPACLRVRAAAIRAMVGGRFATQRILLHVVIALGRQSTPACGRKGFKRGHTCVSVDAAPPVSSLAWVYLLAEGQAGSVAGRQCGSRVEGWRRWRLVAF